MERYAMMDVTDEPLLDAELSLFSEKMTLATFEKLALRYLLIKKTKLDQINEDVGRNCVKAMFNSLHYWREKQDPNKARRLLVRYLMLAAEDGLVNRDDFRFLHTGLEQHYALTKNKSMRERLSQKWEQMKKKLAGWYSLIFLFFSIFNIFTLMFCMAIIHNPSGCSLKSPGPDDQLQNPLMIPCIWEPSEVFPTNTPYFVGLVTIIANLILYLLVIFSSGFYCCHESCHYRWTHIHEQCKIRYFLAICYFMMLLFVGTGYVLGRVGRIVTGGEFMEKPFHESVHYKIVYPNPYSHSVSDGYMSSDEIDEKLVSVLDKIQLVYQCCGVDNYTDYRPYDRWHTRHVPDSCCITISPGCANNQTNIHEKGCFPAIKEQFQIAMKAYNYNRVATIYFFFLLFLALFVLLIKYAVYLGNRQALLQKLIELPEEHKNATGIEEINDDDRENDEASNVDTEKACTVNIDIENNIDDDNEDNALLNGVHSNLENEMSEGSDIDLLIEGELDINAIEEIIGGETQVKVPIDTSFINPAYQEGHNGSTASMAIANVEPPIQMQFIT